MNETIHLKPYQSVKEITFRRTRNGVTYITHRTWLHKEKLDYIDIIVDSENPRQTLLRHYDTDLKRRSPILRREEPSASEVDVFVVANAFFNWLLENNSPMKIDPERTE